MGTEFVRARHDGVEGTALLPRTALRHMPGWVPVDEPDTAAAAEPESKPVRRRRTRKTPATTSPIPPTTTVPQAQEPTS